MKTCNVCNTENEDNALFCTECGNGFDRAEQILEAIKADNTITRERIGRKLGVSPRTVSRELDKMKDKVRFIGSGDNGHWEIIC